MADRERKRMSAIARLDESSRRSRGGAAGRRRETENKRVSFFKQLDGELRKSRVIKDFDRPFRTVGQAVTGLRGGTGTPLSSGYKGVGSFNIDYNMGSEMRMMRYREYDLMDLTTPMCANALDSYASGACRRDVINKDVIKVECVLEDVKNDCEELLFSVLNVNKNLWPWTRSVEKYGDKVLFVKIAIDGSGVTDFYEASMAEIDVVAGEKFDGSPAKKYIWSLNGFGSSTQGFLQAAMANKSNREVFDKMYGGGGNTSEDRLADKEEFSALETIHFCLDGEPAYYPFGVGILEKARFAWKQLRIMEDAMLIYRVVRAPERRVFNIEVGTLDKEQAENFMADTMANMKRVPLIDPSTGDINLNYHSLSHLEDYVLPARGGVGSKIETLPGGQNTDAIQDVEYFKSNLRAALRVPKSYLEYDEALSTARGLSMEDDRFAANIERLQSVMLDELYKICAIHLVAKGYEPDVIEYVTLSMENPSAQAEIDRIDLMQKKIDLIRSMKDVSLGSNAYYETTLMKWSANDAARIRVEQYEDARQAFVVKTISEKGDFASMFSKDLKAKQDDWEATAANSGSLEPPMGGDGMAAHVGGLSAPGGGGPGDLGPDGEGGEIDFDTELGNALAGEPPPPSGGETPALDTDIPGATPEPEEGEPTGGTDRASFDPTATRSGRRVMGDRAVRLMERLGLTERE